MRAPILAMALMALSACEQGVQQADTPAPTPAPAPVAAPSPQPAPPAAAPSPWSLQASAAAGAAIVLSDDQGAEQMRITCRRNPADLHVSAPAFKKIGSEERLTLGAGDELATLVVLQDTPAGRPLEAAGELPAAFVAALEAGRPVAASYGASQIGPLPGPPAQIRSAFAAACRQ